MYPEYDPEILAFENFVEELKEKNGPLFIVDSYFSFYGPQRPHPPTIVDDEIVDFF